MARDNRIDTLKGLLIILVILGHIIIAADNANTLNHAVMGLIYVFHMPLFILVSGYLTKNPDNQSPQEMWRGVGNIFITLVIFHFITATRRYLQNGDFLSSLVNFPYGVLWYLMCLIYWRIILYYTPKALLNRPKMHLSIAIVLSIACGLTHLGNLLAIQRALNFYVFFLLGYYYRQGAINTRWWNLNVLHIATALVLLPLIFWLFPHCGNFLNGADHYTLADIPQKGLILCCSVAMSLLVFNQVKEIDVLSRIGKDSLFFYLYHAILVYALLMPAIDGLDLPRTLPYNMLYTLIILGILMVMSKIKIFKWLMNPFKK